MVVETNSYALFTSSSPKFDFSFLYPQDWKPREIEAKGYAEVFLQGPRSADSKYGLFFAIRVVPTKAEGGKHGTADQFIDDYLNRVKKFANFKQLSKARGEFAASEAVEFVISYSMPLPLNTLNADETTILERRIVVKRGSFFYVLIYSGTENDYHASLSSFEYMAQTFQFSADSVEEARAFRPLVTPASPLIVREKGEDYGPQIS